MMDARETLEFWRHRREGIGPNDYDAELARALRDISLEIFAHRDAGHLMAGTADCYAGTLKAAAERLALAPIR